MRRTNPSDAEGLLQQHDAPFAIGVMFPYAFVQQLISLFTSKSTRAAGHGGAAEKLQFASDSEFCRTITCWRKSHWKTSGSATGFPGTLRPLLGTRSRFCPNTNRKQEIPTQCRSRLLLRASVQISADRGRRHRFDPTPIKTSGQRVLLVWHCIYQQFLPYGCASPHPRDIAEEQWRGMGRSD